MMDTVSVDELRRHLDEAGQSHLLRFWDELAPEERQRFLAELSQLDSAELRDHCRRAVEAARRGSDPHEWPPLRMEPVPPEAVGRVKGCDRSTLEEWELEGLLQISHGHVGALLLAGGQGTRLGVPYPKGMFSVGLPSGKTLYQIQAERLRRVEQLAEAQHGTKCTIPWYIMTSEFTLEPTMRFFKDNSFFNLDPSSVVMFEQRMIPAVAFDGKVILEKKNKIAMAPDGNGGLYQALLENKILEDMERRGVQYLHVYCVDNILVKMADPVFVGFCVKKGADCGAKVVEKAYAAEPVGVVCRVDGVCQVMEYSEVPPEVAEQRGPSGELIYSAGNICNHFFTLEFLSEVSQKFHRKLKQHVAIKKVPFVDLEGNLVKPTKPNGIKMEKFVFDVFQFSRNFVMFEVAREEEFSPLKNADGAPLDTPTTARRSLLAQHYRWVLGAGGSFRNTQGEPIKPIPGVGLDEDPPAICEISPLVSYFGEGLEQLLRDRTLTSPFILDNKVAKELLWVQ
ncbi:UDP-N-acetylhexosamine pyrophosphorylase-like protein 1 [Scleropages formosus]|uniref:UDP-N-acetylglucosamine pyrophosphorylase 1, like 1 n=1 Tax=Scleropages formosus TaxID=113540 RepID=A0A8C9S1N9_SCLFO|nr:UDP-N-acetylhexosamine pyrophosphorylase-like protein 1 [Scleropages formosus]